jgi:hypothetical protein
MITCLYHCNFAGLVNYTYVYFVLCLTTADDKEEDKRLSSKKNRPQEKQLWEEEDEGCNLDLNLKAEYDW